MPAISGLVNRSMTTALQQFHQDLGARFGELNGEPLVADYGDAPAEYATLNTTAGVLDLSVRGRLCLLGPDRIRFLHGQITNDVKKLRPGDGTYAALVTAKGRMESDLNVFALTDELLLDFEPGLSTKLAARLEKFIVADDVQVVNAAPHYGLLSVQGPQADAVLRAVSLFPELPTRSLDLVKANAPDLGDIYLVNHARLDGNACGVRWPADRGLAFPPEPKAPAPLHSAGAVQNGFDLFVTVNSLAALADKLIAAARALGGGACGWTAFETARIAAGIPRFGADMDETNLPLECGIEERAVSYQKGCYLGQEVINRIHSIGHVNRELHRLRLADDLKSLPVRGDKLFKDGKEVGHITSAAKSSTPLAIVALGYVRREVNQPGIELTLQTSEGESLARIITPSDLR
jgi:folate-binding protein YgfZ